MSDLHIVRQHNLGLERAREVALRWAEMAEQKLDVECTYEEGDHDDRLWFERPGVKGEGKVTGDAFELDLNLGALFRGFSGRIEAEITRKLDALLAQEEDHAQHGGRRRTPAAKAGQQAKRKKS